MPIQQDPSHHLAHRSMGDCPGHLMFADGLDDASSSISGNSKPHGLPKIERRPSSHISVVGGAPPSIEAWSPATTVRSTPPFDSQQVSPTRLGSVQSNMETGSTIVSRDLIEENYDSGRRTTPLFSRKVMRLLGRRGSSKIGSVNESPGIRRSRSVAISDVLPSTPTFSTRIYDDNNGHNKVTIEVVPRVAAPAGPTEDIVPIVFSSGSLRASSNAASPFFYTPSPSPVDDANNNKDGRIGDETPTHSPLPTAFAAVKRIQVEGDVEEGGTAPAPAAPTVRDAGTPFFATSAVLKAKVAGPTVEDPVPVVDHGMVLPCAPSDEEKVDVERSRVLVLDGGGGTAFQIGFYASVKRCCVCAQAKGSCRAYCAKGRPCQDSQEPYNEVAPHLLGLFLVYVVEPPLD